MSARALGRYRLVASEERLGVVLAAEDTLLERRVGLMLVPPVATADPARLERIQQEVERAATLVHPNVASVYGLEEGGGRQFVTLEPAAGWSLADLLARGGPELATALEIALTLCDVLTGAKQDGVVHGGLYPGDVVLGEDGAITVRGFGLHELRLAVADELAEPSPSAAYQPPEAAPGLLPDHRADLFALGRIVQEMVAAGDRAMGDAARRVPQGATAALHGALERFLSTDPAQRAQSADELRPHLEELQRELLREPEPEEVGPERRLSPPLRWGLLGAGALLVTIVGMMLWCGPGGEGRPAEPSAVGETAATAVEPIDLAVMPFAAADEAGEELLAAGFGREVARLLARDRGVSVITADSAAAAAAAGVSADRLGAAHVLEGSFVWQRDADISRAEVTVWLSRASDGELLWSETLEGFFGEIPGLQGRVAAGVGRRLEAGARAPGRAVTDSQGAYEAYLEGIGRSAAAGEAEDLRSAVASFERAVLLDPGLHLAHTRQVHLQIALAAAEPAGEALAAARQALTAARRIGDGDPAVRRAAADLELAAGGDTAVVLEELNEALARLPGDSELLHHLALIDRRQSRWDEAIERLTTARRRDPLNLALATDLVRSLAWKRRFDEAAEQADALASLLPEALEPALLRVDLSLRSRGASREARAVLEALPESVRSDPRWQERMLRLDLYEGDYESALGRLPELGLEETEALIERAWIYRHMGRARRSAASFEKARDLLDDRLKTTPGDPALSARLGQAYAGTGGGRLGVRMGQRAVSQLPVTTDAVAGPELVERLARIYVLTGDSEHALDELAFLLEIPSPVTVAVLRLDPAWRPLRGEARFQALLERFGP